MNVLSKQYKGLFHYAVMALTVAAAVLTSPSLADLGWSWLPAATSGVLFVLTTLQRFTPLGDEQ